MYVILTCPVFTVILTELFHIQNFIVLHDDNKLDGILYFAKKTVVGMRHCLWLTAMRRVVLLLVKIGG